MPIIRTLVTFALIPIVLFVVLPHLLFLATRTEFETVAPQKALVFITGCSSGLGREYLRAAVNRGYAVLASVRKEKDALALREEFKGRRTHIYDNAHEHTHVHFLFSCILWYV